MEDNKMVFQTIDNRQWRQQIAQRKITFTTIVTEDTKSVDLTINGELLNYIFDAPALSTDTTFDFTITNEDSETVYTNTGIADVVSTTVLTSAAPIPMSGTMTFTVEFTTAQVAVFDLYMYYR